MTTTKPPDQAVAWYALSADDAAAQLGVEPDRGLSTDKAAQLLAEYGPNALPTEPPPSVWVVARAQLSNPMNIMLLTACGASFAIAQWATAVVVLGLVLLTAVMGTSQELTASAGVAALAHLPVPMARLRRSAQVENVEWTSWVPVGVVLSEAGDVVPADGRILT